MDTSTPDSVSDSDSSSYGSRSWNSAKEEKWYDNRNLKYSKKKRRRTENYWYRKERPLTEEEAIDERYKHAKFNVCFDWDELEAPLSSEERIVVCDTKGVYGTKVRRKFITVSKKKDHTHITKGELFDALVDVNYTLCDHNFAEKILKDTDTQYSIFWGS